MDRNIIEIYSIIISSQIKKSIVLSLNDKILTPKKISQIIGKRINHVSLYLKQLKEISVVNCLNENKTKGRLYQLTELGKKIFNEIKRNESL